MQGLTITKRHSFYPITDSKRVTLTLRFIAGNQEKDVIKLFQQFLNLIE